jgi:hypothetical protein
MSTGHQASSVRVPEPGGVRVRITQEEEAGPEADSLHFRSAFHFWQQPSRYGPWDRCCGSGSGRIMTFMVGYGSWPL